MSLSLYISLYLFIYFSIYPSTYLGADFKNNQTTKQVNNLYLDQQEGPDIIVYLFGCLIVFKIRSLDVFFIYISIYLSSPDELDYAEPGGDDASVGVSALQAGPGLLLFLLLRGVRLRRQHRLTQAQTLSICILFQFFSLSKLIFQTFKKISCKPLFLTVFIFSLLIIILSAINSVNK